MLVNVTWLEEISWAMFIGDTNIKYHQNTVTQSNLTNLAIIHKTPTQYWFSKNNFDIHDFNRGESKPNSVENWWNGQNDEHSIIRNSVVVVVIVQTCSQQLSIVEFDCKQNFLRSSLFCDLFSYTQKNRPPFLGQKLSSAFFGRRLLFWAHVRIYSRKLSLFLKLYISGIFSFHNHKPHSIKLITN